MQHIRTFLTTDQAKPIFRFAPTPSGLLHLGNGLNFALNWLFAKELHADLLLRIDDIDFGRKRADYVEDIFETLDWLGFDWQLGPTSVASFEADWSQKHRLPLYTDFLKKLRASGLVFPCAKSRQELAAYADYPSAFRTQELHLDDKNVAWRIKTPENLEPNDFVILKKDGLPAYQVTSVVDDEHFGVTHIVRGADLAPSSAAQLFLAKIANSSFIHTKFLHHELLQNDAKEKLSKSNGAFALKNIRLAGKSPASIFSVALKCLHLPHKELHNSSDFLHYYLETK